MRQEHEHVKVGGTEFNLQNLKSFTKPDFVKVFKGKLTKDLDLVWNEIQKGLAELNKIEARIKDAKSKINGSSDKINEKSKKTGSKQARKSDSKTRVGSKRNS